MKRRLKLKPQNLKLMPQKRQLVMLRLLKNQMKKRKTTTLVHLYIKKNQRKRARKR